MAAIVPNQKPSGIKSTIIVLAAAWLAWKIWNNRDDIFAKIEQVAGEFQEKLGLTKKES